MTLTPKQLAKLHIAVQQAGLEEPEYRRLLERLGVASGRDLDNEGFDTVLSVLRDLGFSDDRQTHPTFGDRAGMATPAQVEFIRGLWREWSGADDARALDTWLHRFGVSSIRFLDEPRAAKAIDGLKAMKARDRGGRTSPAAPRTSTASTRRRALPPLAEDHELAAFIVHELTTGSRRHGVVARVRRAAIAKFDEARVGSDSRVRVFVADWLASQDDEHTLNG